MVGGLVMAGSAHRPGVAFTPSLFSPISSGRFTFSVLSASQAMSEVLQEDAADRLSLSVPFQS